MVDGLRSAWNHHLFGGNVFKPIKTYSMSLSSKKGSKKIQGKPNNLLRKINRSDPTSSEFLTLKNVKVGAKLYMDL